MTSYRKAYLYVMLNLVQHLGMANFQLVN